MGADCIPDDLEGIPVLLANIVDLPVAHLWVQIIPRNVGAGQMRRRIYCPWRNLAQADSERRG
jgi:hypothetical protein